MKNRVKIQADLLVTLHPAYKGPYHIRFQSLPLGRRYLGTGFVLAQTTLNLHAVWRIDHHMEIHSCWDFLRKPYFTDRNRSAKELTGPILGLHHEA